MLVFCAPHQFIHRMVKTLAGHVSKDAIAISLTKVCEGVCVCVVCDEVCGVCGWVGGSCRWRCHAVFAAAWVV